MYGLVQEGGPFKVFVRRESVGSGLIIRFECKEGMGVLGVRRPGRVDPAPVAAYEEEGIDPAALRAGRFVHVLGNGQRQSYALSRLSPEISSRIPTDRWIELDPHTEYGFRYLVASDEALDKVTASVSVGIPAPLAPSATPGSPPAASSASASVSLGAPESQSTEVSPPRPPERADTSEIADALPPPPPRIPVDRSALPPQSSGPLPNIEPPSLPPPLALPPPIGDTALAGLGKDQIVNLLRAEMAKVQALQQRLAETEDALRKSRSRERDLLELLTRWSS